MRGRPSAAGCPPDRGRRRDPPGTGGVRTAPSGLIPAVRLSRGPAATRAEAGRHACGNCPPPRAPRPRRRPLPAARRRAGGAVPAGLGPGPVVGPGGRAVEGDLAGAVHGDGQRGRTVREFGVVDAEGGGTAADVVPADAEPVHRARAGPAGDAEFDHARGLAEQTPGGVARTDHRPFGGGELTSVADGSRGRPSTYGEAGSGASPTRGRRGMGTTRPPPTGSRPAPSGPGAVPTCRASSRVMSPTVDSGSASSTTSALVPPTGSTTVRLNRTSSVSTAPSSRADTTPVMPHGMAASPPCTATSAVIPFPRARVRAAGRAACWMS